MNMTYHENFSEALPEATRVKEEKKRLEAAGVKYILSCWIDLLTSKSDISGCCM